MRNVASGDRQRSSQGKVAGGLLAFASILAAQVGCHGNHSSGGGQPAATNTNTPTTPEPGSIAEVVAKATEPYWSPAHVLVLPNSTDPQDNRALADIVAKQGGKCGLREMADGVFVNLHCTPFEPIPGARNVISPQKMDLLKKGGLHFTRGSAIPKGDRTEILPDNVDHRVDNFEGPVKNQGAVGACTAFSLSSVMDNAILRLHPEDAGAPSGRDSRDARDAAGWAMSPMHIWAHYANPSMKAAGEAMLGQEVAPLSVWPYSPRQACELEHGGEASQCAQAYHVHPGSGSRDPALQRMLQNANREALYKVAQIDKISARPVNPDAIAAVLATGADVWVGIMVDGHAWQHVKEANPIVPDWRSNEGGHAVALAGYRKGPNGRRQFLVHNSWGGTWGDHGFAWINEEMVQRHIEFAYAVRVEDKQGHSAPQTDDMCPENELIDADTGQCAAMCPGPSRRVNGQCGGGSAPSNPNTPPSPSNPRRRHGR